MPLEGLLHDVIFGKRKGADMATVDDVIAEFEKYKQAAEAKIAELTAKVEGAAGGDVQPALDEIAKAVQEIGGNALPAEVNAAEQAAAAQAAPPAVEGDPAA